MGEHSCGRTLVKEQLYEKHTFVHQVLPPSAAEHLSLFGAKILSFVDQQSFCGAASPAVVGSSLSFVVQHSIFFSLSFFEGKIKTFL